MKPINTLVFIYNSFGDPLFQNLMFSYLKTLSVNVNGHFYIITFEQPAYRIPDDQMRVIKEDLANKGIFWHPLEFHTGKFLLLKKLFDAFQTFWKVLTIRLKYNTTVVFSFANVASAMMVLIKRLFRMKMVVFSYEPHSEFMAELGHWSTTSVKYRVLHYLEQKVGQQADYLMTGTQYMVNRLRGEGVKGNVYRVPTGVDHHTFYFDAIERLRIREEFKIACRDVFLYLGKFGGLYYEVEIPQFFRQLYEASPNAFFLVVTPDDPASVQKMFLPYLEESVFKVTRAFTPLEVRSFISASDMGVSGVPPSPAQKFRSPTKVAEYLLCGLPYITTSGISEDDYYALKYNVGVVVDHFKGKLSRETITQITGLLKEDLIVLRNRCRNVGLEYRSKSKVDQVLMEIYREIGT